MAGGFQATTEEIATLSRDVNNAKTEFDGILRGVQSTCDTLRGSWEGPAAVAFARLMDRFQESQAKLQQALSVIGEGLAGTAQDMDTREEEQGSGLGSIASRL
ncbi:WXG100 family type VII secretion target [Lentzea flaviverrucosa]|uniref:ESAT-6-like protein n=1 Tax=Lentzea flaviverrucosa TaxID=200379 RepID=A0A1H9XY80_9PSEU|nr:WXG100 family type VII secretion target [Lentzea flaviverrucosa]RDI30169.1 WXG100 family type VII secretion target [Lentzea flaviverrucosa]SES51158.1 WXG100 family type VII secretion target [Lentzea flaviverrucosa]